MGGGGVVCVVVLTASAVMVGMVGDGDEEVVRIGRHGDQIRTAVCISRPSSPRLHWNSNLLSQQFLSDLEPITGSSRILTCHIGQSRLACTPVRASGSLAPLAFDPAQLLTLFSIQPQNSSQRRLWEQLQILTVAAVHPLSCSHPEYYGSTLQCASTCGSRSGQKTVS